VNGLIAVSYTHLDVYKRQVRNIFADANVQKDFLDAQYFEPIADSPEQLSQRIRTEEPKWHKLIDDAHIKLE